MIDSTNPRILANNIRKLFANIIGLEAEIEAITPGTTVVANPEGAATDELGKLGVGEKIYSIPKYTPPAYSATEADTGLKWIDGSTIYSKSYYVDTQITATKAVIDSSITNSLVDVVKAEIGSLKIGGNYLGAMYLNAVISKSGVIRIGIDDSGLWLQGDGIPTPETDNPISDLYLTIFYVKKNAPTRTTKKK